MNLHQLECFVTAASCRSFSLAARQLYLSQPNLSKSIEQLENELGVSLFNRTNKGVSLTIDGMDLLNQAVSILNQVKSITDYYNQRKEQRFEFKISTQPIYPVFKSLCQLQESYILIKCRETHRSQVINDVSRSQSEIGVIMTSTLDPIRFKDIFLEHHLTFEIIKEAKATIYYHKDHPISKLNKITQKDLIDYPQIIFNLDEYTENNLLLFTHHSCKTNSVCLAKELMNTSLAYVIQTPWDKELFEDRDILSKEVDDNAIRVQIGFFYSKERNLSLEARYFIKELKHYINRE